VTVSPYTGPPIGAPWTPSMPRTHDVLAPRAFKPHWPTPGRPKPSQLSSPGKLCAAASPRCATAHLTIFQPHAQDDDAESPPPEPSTQVYTELRCFHHLRIRRRLEVLEVHRLHLSSTFELHVQVELPLVSSTAILLRRRPVAKSS
jgi:hypothetical protein